MTISEPIEHGASDPIGTGTPDEIESEMLRFAKTMPEPARAGNWGSGLWTKNLLLEIGQLGEQRLGEHDMPLALESEWGDQEAVDRDFQKMQACGFSMTELASWTKRPTKPGGA
jgi:hypothetical protein